MAGLKLRANLPLTGLIARPAHVGSAACPSLSSSTAHQPHSTYFNKGVSCRLSRARCRVHAINPGRDLLVGDALLLTSFCIYKQLAAVVLSPYFPGWLAPLSFSPTRFTEFVGFLLSMAGTWMGCSVLNGDYENPAESTNLEDVVLAL